MSRRDYRKEYLRDHASPEAKRRRAARNLWNRRLKGKVPAGKEIDHKKPLRSGGGNGMSNIRYRSVSANRADNGHKKTAAFYEVLEEKRASADKKRKMTHVHPDAYNRSFRLGQSIGGGLTGASIGGVAGGLATGRPKDALIGAAFGGILGGGVGYSTYKTKSDDLVYRLTKKTKRSRVKPSLLTPIEDVDPQIKNAPSSDFYTDEELSKRAAIEYRGKTFPGYNKPIENRDGGQHKKIVLAKQGDKIKMIRFGHRGYGHNINPARKKNYLKRSAGIRDKSGRLTKDNKLSANYWSRRVLWPSRQKADGSSRRSK